MGWSREEADKRWEENEARLSAMSIEDLEADLEELNGKIEENEGSLKDHNPRNAIDKDLSVPSASRLSLQS